jgi:hypothetical protein
VLDSDAGRHARPRLALLGFIVLAIGWTWPVAAHLSTRIPHDPGDPILNTWILWWNAHAVPFTRAWWSPPIFVPVQGALALSEHLAGLGVLSTPLQLAGASPLAAYNVCLIASYALSGWFTYLLTYRLTGSAAASVCAGVAFATAPYRAGQLAHIQVLTSQWMPAMLLGLHAYVETGRTRWLALFAAAWLVQGASNGYFLLFLPVLIVLWLAWFVDWRGEPRRGLTIVAMWIAASLLLVPMLLEYRAVHSALGLGRQPDEIVRFSARLSSFVHAPPMLRFWTASNVPTQEDYLFPGITAALAIAAGLIASGRARWNRRADTEPRLMSALVFYAAATLFMYACAFGPGAGGAAGWLRPYRWLSLAPGYDGLRVPARFAMLGVLCLSVGAGLALAVLQRVISGSRILTAVALAGLAIDGAMQPMPLAVPPPRTILPDSADALVLELPADDGRMNVAAMFRAMGHGRPIVNGYSGYTPPHYTILGLALRRGDASPLASLTRSHPLIVLVNDQYDSGGDFRRMVAAWPSAELLGASSGGTLFRLPQTAPPASTSGGVVLSARARDAGGERLVLDLGAPHDVGAVAFNLRWHYPELAERMLIERSDDGTTWQQAWLGWTGGLAFDAAVKDQSLAPMRIDFPPVRARYLRIYPAPYWLGREIQAFGE